MGALWHTLFLWLPAPVALAFSGLFTLLLILIVLRIVKIVLDSLPFL